jgi:hypothetical protein
MSISIPSGRTLTLQVAESSRYRGHSCLSPSPSCPAGLFPSSHASGRTQRPATFLITRSLQEPGISTENQPPTDGDALAGPARARGAVSSQEANAPRQSAPKNRAKCRYFASKKGMYPLRVYAVSCWTSAVCSCTAILMGEDHTSASLGFGSSSGKHVPLGDGYRGASDQAGG